MKNPYYKCLKRSHVNTFTWIAFTVWVMWGLLWGIHPWTDVSPDTSLGYAILSGCGFIGLCILQNGERNRNK